MTPDITLSTPGLVHPILTEDQAVFVHQALLALLNTPEGELSADPEQEQADRAALSELVFFFSEVVDHPEAFGVRSALETKRILRGVKAEKGEAQPRSERKRRQRTRQSWQKRTRAQKRAEAEDYNRARQIMEDEQREAEQVRNDEMKKRIDRFGALIKKETLTNEELQEVLDLMGYPALAAEARQLRAADDPQRRLDDAARRAAEGAGGGDGS